MTSLPTPFIVAFLLVLLALTNHRQLMESASGKTFSLIIYIDAFSMILIGLRWSREWVAVLPIVATLAILNAALLYLAFRSLGKPGSVVEPARDWIHILPALAVAACTLLVPRWVDVPIVISKVFYIILLICLVRQAPDSLQLVRLSWLKNTHLALWGATIFLVISLAVDITITIDFAFYQGRHSANLVGFVSLMFVLLLGWVSVLAGRGKASDHRPVTANESADGFQQQRNDVILQRKHSAQKNTPMESRLPSEGSETAAVFEKVNKLLVEDRLYIDTELNLLRLSRKAGVPSRLLSRAVNESTGLNISQWVNSARIDAACALLSDPEVSVGQAMENSGFLTKSNFNREFRRIKGCNPSQWRQQGLTKRSNQS